MPLSKTGAELLFEVFSLTRPAAEASAWAAASRVPRAIQSPDAAVGAPAKGAAGSPFRGLRLRKFDIDLPRSISP